MNTDPKPYVGDVGTAIDIDVQEDISLGSSFKFNVKKPDLSIAVWTPTLQSDNRTLRYYTQANDFAQAGKYQIQVSLVLGAWSGRCDTVSFMVYELYS